jgi:hypothetical protein
MIEVGEEVNRMREEFVKEDEYREYLLRKEMAELLRKRSLEGRVNEEYTEKIRMVDNLADKLKYKFESKLEEKERQMEQMYSKQISERERAYQEEKFLIIEQLKRQHQKELKELNEINYQNDKKIEELKAEFQRVDAECRNLKEKLIEENNELKDSKPLLNYLTFSSHYENIVGSNKEFTSSNSIDLDTSNDEVKSLLKLMGKFKLPKLNDITLKYVEEKDEVVRDFMLSLEVEALNQFYFNYVCSKVIKIDYYTDALVKVATISHYKAFCIDNSEVNTENFKLLMTAAKNNELIGFRECNLTIDAEFSFGTSLDKSTFTELSLSKSGRADRSDFASNPERLTNIIKALGKCPRIKQNLKKIYLNGCGLDKDVVEKLLKDNLQNCELDSHSK